MVSSVPSIIQPPKESQCNLFRSQYAMAIGQTNQLYFLLYGGEDNTSLCTNTFQVITVEGSDQLSCKRFEFNSVNPTSRKDGHTCVYFNGSLFVLLGSDLDQLAPQKNGQRLLHLPLQQHSRLQPQLLQTNSNIYPLGRKNHSSVLTKQGVLYIYGGKETLTSKSNVNSTVNNKYFQDMYSIDLSQLNSLSWQQISYKTNDEVSKKWISERGLSGSSACIYYPNNSEEFAIVLFGGESQEGYSNETFVFSQNKWSQVLYSGSIPRPREGHSAVITHFNKMFIYGGWIEGFGASNELFELNLTTWSWRQVQIDGPSPTPRFGSMMMYYYKEGKVYIIGGKDNSWRGVETILSVTVEQPSNMQPMAPQQLIIDGNTFKPGLNYISVEGTSSSVFDASESALSKTIEEEKKRVAQQKRDMELREAEQRKREKQMEDERVAMEKTRREEEARKNKQLAEAKFRAEMEEKVRREAEEMHRREEEERRRHEEELNRIAEERRQEQERKRIEEEEKLRVKREQELLEEQNRMEQAKLALEAEEMHRREEEERRRREKELEQQRILAEAEKMKMQKALEDSLRAKQEEEERIIYEQNKRREEEEQLKLEKERQEMKRLEKERIALELAEQERIQNEKLELERLQEAERVKIEQEALFAKQLEMETQSVIETKIQDEISISEDKPEDNLISARLANHQRDTDVHSLLADQRTKLTQKRKAKTRMGVKALLEDAVESDSSLAVPDDSKFAELELSSKTMVPSDSSTEAQETEAPKKKLPPGAVPLMGFGPIVLPNKSSSTDDVQQTTDTQEESVTPKKKPVGGVGMMPGLNMADIMAQRNKIKK